MTATEVLRRLLDERGVEWESGLPTETIVREPNDALYVERPDGRMHVYFRSYLTPEQVVAATLGSSNCTNGERTSERTDLAAENAALREQMERLLTLLRNDCDIDASWDGLRRFWSIGLTEDGCLMRDRACKAEAENAMLRAAGDTWAENDAKLRELVRDMWFWHYEGHIDSESQERQMKHIDRVIDCMRELGVDE